MSVSIETYDQALAYLHGRINFERTSASLSATDFKLDRMRHLLDRVGNPQDRIPAVHVAGTKGKGSTAAMIAVGLRAAGYVVGLFTSPHLERFEERIRVNGECIEPEVLVTLVRRLANVVSEIDEEVGGLNPTYFELTTALGWLYFEQRGTDIVVLEVGLGGRLDSTNICRPEVAVITTISRDHTQILGDRLSQIAAEKCGIIKDGIPVVSGVLAAEAREVVEHFAAHRNAKLSQLERDFVYSIRPISDWAAASPATRIALQEVEVTVAAESFRLSLSLLGRHQGHNAAVALAALCALRDRGWRLATESLPEAFLSVEWPARIQVVSTQPYVILDAAHNWASVTALVRTLDELPCSGRRCLILSTTKDKDSLGLLRQLLPAFDTIIVTQYVTNPRAVPAAELQRLIASMSLRSVHLASTPEAAWQIAQKLTTEADLICIAGSFFLAAEMRVHCAPRGCDEIVG